MLLLPLTTHFCTSWAKFLFLVFIIFYVHEDDRRIQICWRRASQPPPSPPPQFCLINSLPSPMHCPKSIGIRRSEIPDPQGLERCEIGGWLEGAVIQARCQMSSGTFFSQAVFKWVDFNMAVTAVLEEASKELTR